MLDDAVIEVHGKTGDGAGSDDSGMISGGTSRSIRIYCYFM